MFAVLKRNWNNARQATAKRYRLIRVMFGAYPSLAVLILLYGLVGGLLPNAVVLAMGRIVSNAPAALAHGMGSLAGHRLVGAIVVFGVLFVILLLLSPIGTGISIISRTRMTFYLQSRLMKAISAPVGISHLEDPTALEALAGAQGKLMSLQPGDAPVTFANAITVRIQGITASIIVMDFRWWLGVGCLLFWLVSGTPMRAHIQTGVQLFRDDARVLRRAEYFNTLATRPAAAKELRIFGLANWAVDELRRQVGLVDTRYGALKSGLFRAEGVVNFMVLLFYGIVGVFLAHVAYTGHLSISRLAVLLAVIPLTRYAGTSTPINSQFEFQLGAFPYLEELELDLASRRSAMHGSISPGDRPREAVRFESVSFRYPGSEHDVLTNLTLSISAGRSTAIVGANGAGKTTIVKLLARLHDPTSGCITVDGIDTREFDPEAWQQRLAVVYQDYNKYPVTARENVAFGAIAHADNDQALTAAADQAAVLSVIEQLPHGWDTMLSRQYERGTDLSEGQWQRVALARALFAARNGAGILILDEPTASLDVRGEAAFYDRFLEITEGLTTVVISHRFSTVRLADHICVVGEGGLLEEGSHQELLEQDGLYAEMFHMQAERFTGQGENEVGEDLLAGGVTS